MNLALSIALALLFAALVVGHHDDEELSSAVISTLGFPGDELEQLDHLIGDGDSRDVALELHRRLSSSLSSASYASDFDFDRVCQQLRTIFHEQCSCGDELESASAWSDQVECDYSDIHAIALFNEDLASPFQVQKMNSLKVCKHQIAASSFERVCTTIFYSNNVGTHCEVTVGGSDRKCEECDLCRTGQGFPGLTIGCDGIDPRLSTEECTSASQILDLTASGADTAATAPGTATSLLRLVGAVLAVAAVAMP